MLFLFSLSLLISRASSLDTSCRAELIKADKNGDARLDGTEFVDAVNQLSEGAFGKVSSLNGLSSVLRETFDKLACQCDQVKQDVCCGEDSKAIDFILLKDRIPYDADICGEINNSIHQALQARVPSLAPKPAIEFPCPTLVSQSRNLQSPLNVTFIECIRAMNSADSNNDNFLNQNEYVAFVNLLTDGQFEGESLGTVPVEIRRNFFQLSGDNGFIDISGSKPGDDQTPEQVGNLQNICTSTVTAINAANGLTSAPTASPTASTPTMAPIFDQSACFMAMVQADSNGDSQLNQSEYFIFVNIAAGGAFDGLSFPDLDQTLRQNFFMWRDQSTNQINIFGTRPGQNADADQMAFLDMVCTETEQALNPSAPTPAPNFAPTSVPPTITSPAPVPTIAPTTGEPIVVPTTSPSIIVPPPTVGPTTTAPSNAQAEPTVDVATASPTTPEPTLGTPLPTLTSAPTTIAPVPTDPPVTLPPTPPGAETVTIPSNFVISNTFDLSADDILDSQNFDDLTEAYSNLAQDVVAGLARRRRLRRRRLTVSFVENSAAIASIADMARCPMGTPDGTVCQMVIASYRVLTEKEDTQAVKDDYTMATNVAINDGALQEELEIVNPDTPIAVVEGVPPRTPTPAPTTPPSDDEGLSSGAIAGIAVAGTVVVGGLGAALFFVQRKHVPPKNKPLGADVELDSVDDGFGGSGNVGSMRPAQNEQNPFGTSRPQTGATATSTNYGDGSSDDSEYSFQSGSFYESGTSTFQSPASPAGTTATQLQNYEFDDPSDKRYKGAAAGAVAGAAVGVAAAKAYESSSNAGSSGWSSSEEDTDDSDGSSYSSARSEEESNDSFFNDKNVPADSQDKFVDDISPANVTSAQPPSPDSGSYDDSTFSSDFTPQPSTPPEAGGSAPVPVPVPIPIPSRTDEDSSESYTSSDNSSYDESTYGSNSKSRGFASGDTSIPSAALRDSSTTLTGGKSSAETEGRPNSSGSQDLQDSLNERATELESLVERGDWEGVIASAQKFEADTEAANTPSTQGSRKLGDSNSGSVSESSGGSSGSSYTSSGFERERRSGSQDSQSYDTSREPVSSLETSGDTDCTGTSTSETPEDARRRAEYRAEVEALVRMVVPEEIDNVDVMMVQFRGREAELVSTLRNMQERSVAQRARQAVHKSRGQPPRRDQIPGQYRKDGNYSTDSRMSERTEDTHGSAAGSAAIAAASVPRPAGGRVPIHPPPVPPHETTQLKSLGSVSTPSAQSTSASDSYTTSTGEKKSRSASNSGGTTSQSRSTSQSASNDSRSYSSSESSSSSTSSAGSGEYDSRSASRSGSSGSSSGSYSQDNEYHTSQGTSTNYGTSQGTSYETSQGTSYETSQGTSLTSEDFEQPRRPTQRRTSIKPWLTGDDDTQADLEDSDLGVSVGGDFHSITR